MRLRIDLAAPRKVVHKALDLGIMSFDEADTYSDPHGTDQTSLGEILGDRRKDHVPKTTAAIVAAEAGNRDLQADFPRLLCSIYSGDAISSIGEGGEDFV